MRQRTSYPKPFKAQVVQECLQPGAFVASVAMSHGINANEVRKWLPIYRDRLPTHLPAFVPAGDRSSLAASWLRQNYPHALTEMTDLPRITNRAQSTP